MVLNALSLALLSAFRMVVIPVEFSDRAFELAHEDLAGTVSLAQEYFNRQFQGTVEFTFDLAQTVTLSKQYSYYGANYSSRKDVFLYEAVKEACNLADSEVDFSLYDNDGDGQVDNVALIFAGLSEADGADSRWIWPQRALLKDLSSTITLDGCTINGFTASCELKSDAGSNPRAAGIGLFCHELAHSFGLYDLYDTDGSSSGGESPGLWLTSLMDDGCNNDDTQTPPNFSALDFNELGIGTCDTLAIGNYTLYPINLSGRYLIAPGEDESEYFLFECRNPDGWDAPIGAGGLLIYHIDKSSGSAGYSDYYQRDLTAAERWEYGQINCRPDHMCAEIICANPDAESVEEIFFPQSGHDSFGSDTTPAFQWWDGSTSSLALINITRNSDGSISFKVVEPISIERITTFQDAAIVSWKADSSVEGVSCYEIIWTDGSEENSAEVPADTSCYTIEGLSAQSSYSVTVRMKVSEYSSFSSTARFTTKVYLSSTYPYIYLSGSLRNIDGSFLEGSKIPLRIYNATDVGEVLWYLNDKPISTGSDGFYTIEQAGTLKAEIIYLDGTREYITKEITL